MSRADSNISDKFYYRLFLRPLGLNSQNSSVIWLLLLLGGFILGGAWYFQAVAPVIAILYIIGILVLSFVRPDYSLYVLLLGVLVFDQYGVPGFPAFTTSIDYFKNIKEISYLPPIFNAGVINIIELHLLFLILSLLFLTGVKKDFKLRPIPVWPLFLFFAACFSFALLYGVGTGGDLLVSLWETRAMFYFFLLYLITPQIVQSKKQIHILFWIFIVAISFKAFQAVGRFVSLGFTTGGYSALANHEDPVFIVTLFMLMLGFFVYKARDKQYGMLIFLFLPLLIGFYAAQRRAAFAAAMVSFTTFIVLLPYALRMKFLAILSPLLILFLIYGAVFWNSNSPLGQPVQMIKSGLVEPTKGGNMENYYSNLYREQENYNLARTVVNNPVMGIGFGKKYAMPIELAPIGFPLRDYIPHNAIYWIFVKTGAVGFFAFWLFFNGFVAKGAKVFKRIKDPYLKAVAMVSIIAVISQMVVSFYDLQLTYYRNMIYLGVLMGFMGTLDRLSANDESSESDELALSQPESNL